VIEDKHVEVLIFALKKSWQLKHHTGRRTTTTRKDKKVSSLHEPPMHFRIPLPSAYFTMFFWWVL
jgi:hypothetical protein